MTLGVKTLAIFILCIHPVAAQEKPQILRDREGHKTEIVTKKASDEAAAVPPKDSGFELIKYPTKIGQMSAYLSKNQEPSKGCKSPAIIWLTGGFPAASPGAYLWEETATDNEQSARVYRYNGIVMMFPSVRGAMKGNPGVSEYFYGEVDDVLSAYEYLSKLENIDPKRIYLGGHSTGGTLALLCAAASDKFAGVISLGPTDTDYGKEYGIYAWNGKERKLRHPINYINTIKVPTYVMEGEFGNATALVALEKENKNSLVKIVRIDKADHFNCIHAVNEVFQEAIKSSADGLLTIKEAMIRDAYKVLRETEREQRDLRTLAEFRGENLELFKKTQLLSFYFYTADTSEYEAVSNLARDAKFTVSQPEKLKTDDGKDYYFIKMQKKINCQDLNQLFEASASSQIIADGWKLDYQGWGIE